MRIEKVSHAGPNRNRQWTPTEDTVLFLMVGRYSYAQIALRLGRSAGSVQRRASRKGFLARKEHQDASESRMEYRKNFQNSILTAPEEDLMAYVPECDEPPVLPHAGNRVYQREYKRAQRAAAKESA